MKEILLQYFSVKLDESGKELEEPSFTIGKKGTKIYSVGSKYIDEWKNAQTVIKLPTLSEFCKKILFTQKEFGFRTIQYINFVSQPLTLEQFIGEDAIFVGWEEFRMGGHIGAIWLKHTSNQSINFNSYKTIEQAINAGVTLYINPDKI